ncbi:hypothetical protein [Nostoc sp.]|uniref:hypothetical protein n=1 Tax=Nostoc sp. TaxID=1180 RepID=UPI002FFD2244
MINKANRAKFVLGMIAITSFAAITPRANAVTLTSNSALGNIMSQAKLNLDSPIQQAAVEKALEKYGRTVAYRDCNPYRGCLPRSGPARM